jgi:hypothetical protein
MSYTNLLYSSHISYFVSYKPGLFSSRGNIPSNFQQKPHFQQMLKMALCLKIIWAFTASERLRGWVPTLGQIFRCSSESWVSKFSAVEANILTPDEVRQEEGWNPKPVHNS